MKQWPELSLLTLSGKHSRLQNLTQSELEAFCDEHSTDQKLSYLSIAGNIRGYKITDFSHLTRLPALKELYIGDAISQEGFEQLCKLATLTELHIQHAGKISSIDALKDLPLLQGLTISTPPGWDPKLLHVPTLSPVEHLVNLRYLNLAGITFDNGRLEPLRNLHKIERLIVIGKYWEDAMALKESCPMLDTSHYETLIATYRKRKT